MCLVRAGRVAAIEDASAGETEPLKEETEEIRKELEKLNFPQVEGDTAPSALLPKTCSSLQKYVTKLEGLLAQFVAATTLTELQTKILVCVDVFRCT